MLKRAVFFDRDGTLIKENGYLRRIEDLALDPAGIECARFFYAQGYLLFVITNQSGVARGFFDESFVQKAHIVLDKYLNKKNIFITKYYYCPHHPTESIVPEYKVDCQCRKPKPGMILLAKKEFNIDLKNSFVVGDKESDMQAGQAAGCNVFLIQEFNDFLKNNIEKVLNSGKLKRA
jgi:D-glycero-D-manno-heptose 1,7-bisphosphate phosphatase